MIDQLVLDAQVLQQRLVGELVDAGLVAAQVDRHAVGRLVVERRQQALAGGHGFAVNVFAMYMDSSGICNDAGSLTQRALR